MPIYVYRTYPPEGSVVASKEFEVEQSIHANALVTDPESGFPVKRVISGGYVYLPNSKGTPSSSSCCGGGCGCH
jgi:hypothetical protein